MQKSIFTLFLSLMAFLSVSCFSTQTREQIALRNEELHQRAVEAVMNAQFVLEAHRLEFRRGGTANVMSNINFIALRNGQVIIQTAFNRGWPGPNNLGGVTYRARPSNIRIGTDRRGNINVTLHAQGPVFSGRIVMTIFAGSNSAVATVYPTFSGNRLTFRGEVVPAETSRVFQGRSL